MILANFKINYFEKTKTAKVSAHEHILCIGYADHIVENNMAEKNASRVIWEIGLREY